MLFQMCYGPEIKSIYQMVQRNQGITVESLTQKFQYNPQGDIKSLVDGVVTFLKDLDLLDVQEGLIYAKELNWSSIEIFKRLNRVSEKSEPDSLNHVFSTLFFNLFVLQDQLFISNMHYRINHKYERNLVGQEKINAWKRIMEYLGLGYRVYSGFYALPHQNLMKLIIKEAGRWEGPLHLFCEHKVHPIIPCINDGKVFKGIIFALSFMDKQGMISLSSKQDLPYRSYGTNFQWNWIELNGKVE